MDTQQVSLYVRIANRCNANCSFCEFHDNVSNFNFNFIKFKNILTELLNKGIVINKVSFTGGEPTLNYEVLQNAVRTVRNLSRWTFIVVNTNGSHLRNLQDLNVDSISMSRHHYNNALNSAVFNARMPNSMDIASFKHKHKIHLSCNLLKGCIDNGVEVRNYLEFAKSVGVHDVGFVSLMTVNSFCRDNFVDFKGLIVENENLICNQYWNYDDKCRCQNYLYLPPAGTQPVKVYTRFAVKHTECAEGRLMFDGEYLRQGFNGELLY
jgi:MoaA/NifB/PqqE/SkfB family radical SAM enzyme